MAGPFAEIALRKRKTEAQNRSAPEGAGSSRKGGRPYSGEEFGRRLVNGKARPEFQAPAPDARSSAAPIDSAGVDPLTGPAMGYEPG